MEWAAQRVLDLHSETPGATLGVLVRRNATVALLMSHLRRLGLDASEEGATALTDSPAVATCLALLRLADHPGDALARYHVALSPLGAVSGVTDFHDPAQARSVALRLRQRLMAEGYGPVITGWARALRDLGALDDREENRMLQLAELGHRWDPRSTLRPQDFVRFVEHEALEAPSEAWVRVMTVHKAKGLEFDIVVLPELDLRLTRGRGLYQAVLPLRDPETGRVLRIFPSLARAQRPLFPEVAKAAQQDRERELHDALGVVYVALTRARHALYLFAGAASEAGGKDLPFSPAGVLRGALCSEEVQMEPGEVLYERGSRTWWKGMPLAAGPGEAEEPPGEGVAEVPLLMARTGGRGARHLHHRTPSSPRELTEGSVERLLSLGHGAGRRRGTLVHAWLEQLSWLEEWGPAPETLLAVGRGVFPDLTPRESEETWARLVQWLEAPDVQRRLRRDFYPPGSQVLTEEPFAFRWDDVLYRGRIDRLVLAGDGDAALGAEVLDFKTDEVDPHQSGALARAAEGYREQMQIYRRAVASAFGLPLETVRGALVFLPSGRVVDSLS
jgi:ATP-dependent exoDNAse (exonuclease V) beta subunit